MTTQDNKRSFTIWQLLGLNGPILWQLTIGASITMLGGALALTGAPLAGMIVAAAGIAGLGWGCKNALYLLRHDLPLLRNGTLVAACVTGPVGESPDNLYRITYRLPGESAERDGVFLAANQSAFDDGEAVAIMINPRNPTQLLEISGRYEPLFDRKSAA